MREKIRDPQRLEHMLNAATLLLEADESINLEMLSEKDYRYFGIVKLLEIFGEACCKLTSEFKESHPEMPWNLIAGMRHVLVHGYYLINKEDVISTIRKDLPIFKIQLSNYLLEFQ